MKAKVFQNYRPLLEKEPPLPVTPQCQVPIPMQTPRMKEWRERHYGKGSKRPMPRHIDNPMNCTYPSVVELDGYCYCRRHAGAKLLDMFVKGKLVEKKK